MRSRCSARVKVLLLSEFILLALAPKVTADQRLDYFIFEHPDVSYFFSLLQTSPFLRSVILWKPGSLFVPKNEAIHDFIASGRKITNATLLYHFCNFQMPLSELKEEKSISTETRGNVPIWITKTTKDLFLNNAKYIVGNFRVFMQSGESQSAAATIVHIIDRVLDPTVPETSDSSNLHNPDAGKFLENISAYDVSNHQLATIYRDQVLKLRQIELFKNPGFHTFFIPVDAAFRQYKLSSAGIDPKVIYGHIIPKIGIFLRTIKAGDEFETYDPQVSQIADPLEHSAEGVEHPPKRFSTVITFEKTFVDGREIWLINSDNRQGDEKHRKGVVQAEIIRGNIPVKNGVVHLISKPLVIIDMNVFQTFEWYATKQHVKPMWNFLELFRKLQSRGLGEDIRQILEGRGTHKGVTLFVPSNDAVEKSGLLKQNNLTATSEILRTHIIHEIVSADDMIEHSKMTKSPFQLQTAVPGRKLLFSSIQKGGNNNSIHVEGGGVNATVISPDFGATNGYIHIIDRVLGLPDQTVQEKLRTHSMLKSTYLLWQKLNLDGMLNESPTLTFFAPSDKAWTSLQRHSHGAYHNFFESATQDLLLLSVLKRHFIPNKVYSIEDLAVMSAVMANKTVPKEMKGNWTVSRYPIETSGPRGFVKVNESSTLLPAANSYSESEALQSSTLSPNPQLQATPGTHVQEESHYYIYWNRMWAHVIRTNVRCTNGIIHIIDDVLMDAEEITVAAAPLMRSPVLLIVIIPTALYFRAFQFA